MICWHIKLEKLDNKEFEFLTEFKAGFRFYKCYDCKKILKAKLFEGMEIIEKAQRPMSD
jgi:hypothetical protein